MHPSFESYEFDELRHRFKTGDLILFHGLDNINPLFIGTYYGHIGVVYVDPEDTKARPKIFEAFNTSDMPFFPKECSKGIVISDLKHRLNSYRGYSFYKELVIPIDVNIQNGFKSFIEYAIENMYYNKSVIINGINKLLLNECLCNGTNCGELAYLSLIKLGIIPREELHNNRRHHLAWLAGIENLSNNAYRKPVYVLANYFKT